MISYRMCGQIQMHTKAYREYLNAKYAEWTGREKPIKVCFGLRGKPDWVN